MEEKSRIGDIFAIQTNIGFGLFQVIQHIEKGIDVIRVLFPIIQDTSQFSKDMADGKERYFIKFPVLAAYNKNLIIKIGNFNIPEFVKIPKKYRMLDYVPHRNIRNWYVVDAKTNSFKKVSNINDDFLSLSSDAIWNDTFLKERIEENWNLKDWK